jgi:hypothetical protein
MKQITDLDAAQRIDDRIRAPASDTAWPPSPRRTACTANRCSSGDKRCPCPEACELPDNTLAGRVFSVLDRLSPRHFWFGYAAFLLACAAGLHLIFN